MTEFGPAEIITVEHLVPGDFVIEIPAQSNVRGFTANSAVREAPLERAGDWTVNYRPRQRRTPVRSRIITFADRSLATVNVPVTFTVTVRRPLTPAAVPAAVPAAAGDDFYAWDRAETATCQAGTPGCPVNHRPGRDSDCETW